MPPLHYHDTGTGPAILWIHGFPLSSAIFEPQTAIRGYRHIRPDLPGFGDTPPSEKGCSMASYARALLDLLDSLSISHAVVAGVSMGGYIAMEIARATPERIDALLLLDTRETPDSDAGRSTRNDQAAMVEKSGTAALIDSMVPQTAIRRDAQDRIRAIMATASAAGVIQALHAMSERPDSTATLRALHVPALVIVGDHDPITPPTDSERMAALIPNAELAPIAQARHLAAFERPEQVNPLIAAFLMRHVIRAHAEAV